jgi:methyltransferase, FkbM family
MENQDWNSQEKIVEKLEQSYREELEKNGNLSDISATENIEIGNLQMKLLQISQQFVRSFDRPLVKSNSLKGKIKYISKKVIAKILRFILKPYAEQMLNYQQMTGEYLGQALEVLEKDRGMILHLQEENKAIIERNDLLSKQMTQINERFVSMNMQMANGNILNGISDDGLQISYSQVGEDCIIDFIMKYIDEKKPFDYLDIGCNHYKHLSNTYHFYQKGYRGVLVDANPKFIEDIKFHRPNDTVINVGVGSNTGEELNFYVLNGDGLSSFNKEAVDKAMKETSWLKIEEELKVPIITINEIIEKHFETTPTMVSIDIEGGELEILTSMDFVKYRPLIFVIETIEYSEKLNLNNKRMDILDFMKDRGYVEYAFTGVNSIFLDTSVWER